MKTRMLSLVVLMVLAFSTVSSQILKMERIEVAGNCVKCEQRIEEAAKSVDGVTSAEWNLEMKMLEITYDSIQVNSRMVQKSLANAGFDTKLFHAGDKSYDELPECCKYERMIEDIYKKDEIIKIASVRGTIDWKP